MSARSLLLDNLSWKLLSLTLALLIWSGARLFMHQEIHPLGGALLPLAARDFSNIPIRRLSSGSSTNAIRIDPPSVILRVGGEIPILDRLTEQDALVFVEVPAGLPSGAVTNRVEVRLPQSVRLVSVIPERVIISPAP